MRRTVRRPGVVLSSALLAVAAAVVAPAAPAAAAPTTPAASGSTAAPTTRAVPTPGPSRRVCPPATAGTVTCYAEERTDVVPATANAAPAGYGPADLRSAYSIPANAGAGVTVATVVAYDYPTAAADLATYRSQFGLPALGAGQFTKVNQSGASGPLPVYDAGWAGEAALDVQMITATCPACKILLVEASSSRLSDVAAAARTAARLGATVVSNSYGAEDDGTTSLAASYAASGVTYLASTGDEGYDRTVSPSFPATAPNVIAVGGTSLRPAGTSRGWTESAWSGAGHGTSCSTTYAKPAFQNGVTTGCAGRAVADVAAVGDPDTGVAVYNSGNSSRPWRVYGGTSASAPIVAGIAAVANQPGVTGQVVYGNRGSFHDVTGGQTGSCSTPVLCAAGAGWDGPTGVGTPDGVEGFGTPFGGCGGTPATPAANSVTSAGRYVPVTPRRVLDTRLVGTTLGSGGVRTLDLGPYLPGAASAVVVNVTVTNPTAAGFVTAWPAGTTRPLASTLNTVPGLTRANEATVALGATPDSGGAPRGLSLYNSVGSADLVVDLLGWYTTAGDTTAALTYHPAVSPSRVVDTRSTSPLSNLGNRSVVCATLSQYASSASLVTHVAAVAVTLTAVDPAAAGYLKAWNGGVATEPLASSVNFAAGQIVPNATVVPVSCLDSSCSQVTFAVANRISPSTQVVVDVVGVYAADPIAGLVFRAQTPQRIVDTRSPLGFGPLGTDTTATVAVPGATPSGAVAANVTAVSPAASTFLTVFGGGTRPSTSNLNPVPGEIVPAEVVTGVDASSRLSVYNLVGRVDVVVDIAGVFVPPGS